MTKARAPSVERRMLLLALGGPFPLLLCVFSLDGWSLPRTEGGWIVVCGSLLCWGACLWGVSVGVDRAFANVASVLVSLRQGDFSVRTLPTSSRASGSRVTALSELNGLADALAVQQNRAVEARALLDKVMAEIDAAVFAFDRSQHLELVNRAGERLLARRGASRSLGSSAADLGLAELLEGSTPRVLRDGFGSEGEQWELRRMTFRLQGLPHHLVVLSDVRDTLRQEERQAWQRVIRVISHEINNSLAPIRSMAEELHKTLHRVQQSGDGSRPADLDADVSEGLEVIARRAGALDRFMASYARLAKLPPPRLGVVDVGSWVARVVRLEQRLEVQLAEGPAVQIRGDQDQLDQLLINLVQNAVDAVLEAGGGKVEVEWRLLGSYLEITVTDDGAGVSDTANLFVPFFTTKPEGTGIGLVLCRQICEAHRGTLTLRTRSGGNGAVARLLLPRS